ncbi:hypothetical protein JOC86_003803 [Bacillus pakistanensis]|uniref:Cytosolic protein n=1 Tax=Rossellomorea pakistanensis TaxID=992288 RepID=A0ABS2NHF1_9BACI|nr:DUF6282 family protein [Bacillus pakistanensis]MBM7587230.1 hypothetical protein [Bacillus pakistanensis]
MKNQFHPLLEGSYDFHVHSSPSIFKRRQTDWELLEDAKAAKMGGIVLKSHESSTAERAFLLNEKEPSVSVFGGIVLNQHVGGLNPYAVETALKMGGKVVWFPTLSAGQHQQYFKSKNTKLFNGNPLLSESTVSIDEDGHLIEEVEIIFRLITDYDAVLATGHMSLKEQHQIVRAAKEAGVRKIIIQHADMGISKIPLEDQLYFASEGCMIEKCLLACSSDFHDLTVEEMAKTIEIIGHESCILVTDYGQPHHEAPVYAMNRFVEELLSHGVSEEQVIRMLQENPRTLLGVDKNE